jgi:DedD protein
MIELSCLARFSLSRQFCAKFHNFGLHGMAEKDLLINTRGDAAPDSPLALKKRARRRLVGAIALALLAVIVLPMVMDQEPRPLTQDIQIRIPSQDPGASSFVSRIAPKLAPAAPTPLPQETKATPPSAPVAAVSGTAPGAGEIKPDGKPEAKPEAKQATKPEPKAEPKHEAKPEPKAAPAKAASPAAAAPKAPTPPVPVPDNKTAPKPAENSVAAKNAETARAAALLNDEHWIVQLGAYRNAENAKSITGKIKALGLPTFTDTVDTPHGPSTRVRSGPFASREAAEKAQERLKKTGIGAPLGGVVAQAQ